MKMSKLSASSFKILLITMLLVSISVGIAGFIFIQGFLNDYAIDVSHKQKDALASNSVINALNNTEKELKKNADIRKKIGNLRADSQFPEFLVVSEVQKIADNNGIKVKAFSYGSGATSLPNQTTTPTPSPTTGPTTNTTSTGGKTITLLVDLENPVDQKSFLQFIHDIEQHLPKMRLNGLSISPAEAAPDKINTGQLTVELYLT
jgi:hypothetical protein